MQTGARFWWMSRGLIVGCWLLGGCAASDAWTQQERIKRDRTDAAVAEALFEDGLDSSASYHVRRDGSVTIQFADSVSAEQYVRMVERLRSHPAIPAVRAEQAGAEVCPLRR